MQLPVIHVRGLHNEQREKPKPSVHAGKAALDNPIHNPRKSFAVSEWLPLAGVRTRLSSFNQKAQAKRITRIDEQLMVSGEKRVSSDPRDYSGIRANLRSPYNPIRQRAGFSQNTLNHQFFMFCQFVSGVMQGQAGGESYSRWRTVNLPATENGHILAVMRRILWDVSENYAVERIGPFQWIMQGHLCVHGLLDLLC
jgi:hypothetical protein